jgi:hypothetical protein
MEEHEWKSLWCILAMLCEFHIGHCQLSRMYLIYTTFLKSNLFVITCWGKDLTPLGRYEGLRISKIFCI